MANVYKKGDRVSISSDFSWAKGATGTIDEPPSEVVKLVGDWDNGLTRQERSALGEHTVYWIWFDESQYDAEGHGPYKGGCIWASALNPIL